VFIKFYFRKIGTRTKTRHVSKLKGQNILIMSLLFLVTKPIK